MRVSAKEALKSSIFDDIRVKHFEKPCPLKIHQRIFGEGSFDYETYEEKQFGAKDYQLMLLREQKKIKK